MRFERRRLARNARSLREVSRACIAALLCAAAGCSRAPEPEAPRNLLVIVVDTLRRDALGAYGSRRGASPRLDALAQEALVFDRAYAQGTYTPSSFLSYMSSTWVRRHGWDYHVAYYPPAGICGWTDIDLLAEVLARSGFRTAAYVANHRLHPRLGFARGFETWNQQRMDGELADKQTLAARGYLFGDAIVAREGVREIQQWTPDQRHFLYLHLMSPHLPIQPSEEAAASQGLAPDWAPRGRLSIQRMRRIGDHPTDEQRNLALAAYHAGVWDADRRIGEVLAALDAAGQREHTVVAFFADHGEGLWEHGEWGHSSGVWQSLAHVPLMLRAPGLAAGRVADRPVALMDMPPTLLGLLGLADRQPRSWQGRSLLAGAAPRPVLIERFGAVGITADGRFKAFGMPGTLVPDWELYDVERDPAESRPLDNRARENALIRQWIEWDAQHPKQARAQEAEAVGICRDMSSEDRASQERELRALGYLE